MRKGRTKRRKIFELEDLDCANCAAKIEEKLNACPGVEEATITFSTRQLRLTAQEPEALLEELTELARLYIKACEEI